MVFIYITSWGFQVFTNKLEVLVVSEVLAGLWVLMSIFRNLDVFQPDSQNK